MKGEAVSKRNELVFLDTTGLFEIGSAQYDRIRVPTENGEIEYDQIGYTEGYGSIQFGPDTRKRISQVTQLEEGRKVVRRSVRRRCLSSHPENPSRPEELRSRDGSLETRV